MVKWQRLASFLCVTSFVIASDFGMTVHAAEATTGQALTRVLDADNEALGLKLKAVGLVDDMSYLRRVSVDLIGRIPSNDEINEYMGWPVKERRDRLVNKLMDHPRFVDRWTTFFADMLRLRANESGGPAALAFVHKSLRDELPYDEMVRRFISANGKAGAIPEVAFVLGDNADSMALAGVTSQTFMGLQIGCAQCHDHPFDKWTREDFYGFASYFGKVRRYENDFTKTVYTREVDETNVLWPPEGKGEAKDRKPMKPKFLVNFVGSKETPTYITRLEAKRKAEREALALAAANKLKVAAVDDLLTDAADKAVERAKNKKQVDAVTAEATADRRKIDLMADLYNESKLRQELATQIVNPRNRYFAWTLVNRVWADLMGKGIVDPVDNFAEDNKPSHPKTLDFMADEFVAGGFQLKPLVRMIVTSEPYQRGQAVGLEPVKQQELESAFLAVPARRMLGEVLYDSIVVAGHLQDYKYPVGANKKTIRERIRVPVASAGEDGVKTPQNLLGGKPGTAGMNQMAMAGGSMQKKGYNLEKGIELNFDDVLKKAAEEAKSDVSIEVMQVKSPEEIEAERMQMEMKGMRRTKYVDRMIEKIIDDNPQFGSSFRMASPADPEHFVRVFGQTDRSTLGEYRDHSPNMRQALMMLNGRLTHEASRVGSLEPMHQLLVGKTASLDDAIKLAYREILTREVSPEEMSPAKTVIKDAATISDGMADLRWVLLNSNEFRYLP